MIAKSTFLILFVLFVNHSLRGQEYAPSVTLISDSLNRAHPFYDILVKKDKKYINWLYFHSKGLSDTTRLKKPLNKPLVFRIQLGDSIVQDTLSNCVHPQLYEDERESQWQSEIPLYGSFPSYINFHLKNDPKVAAKIDVHIHRAVADIKMYVLTEDGNLVYRIVDNTLRQGRHRFHWFTADIKSGTYLLFTEIGTHLTIHPIQVEKNWFANLFSRDKEISRKKRVFTTDFESFDVPVPEGEYHYVHMDRFGTSLGLNLLAASMVKMKLFTIQGEYISTIKNEKVNKGKIAFLLNKHVEESGWYFIQLSINDSIKHIKIKIKK